jgi:hypothetical protein
MGDSHGLVRRLRNENLAEIINFIKNPAEQQFFLNATSTGEILSGSVLNIAKLLQKTFDYSQCPRDYDWYLRNVHSSYHYKFFDTSEFVHVGEIQSAYRERLCLVLVNKTLATDKVCRRENVLLFDMHLFSFSKNGTLHSGDSPTCCLDTPSLNLGTPSLDLDSAIISNICRGRSLTEELPSETQIFRYEESARQIVHVLSGECVTLVGETEGEVRLRECVGEDERQRWFIHEPWWRRVQ